MERQELTISFINVPLDFILDRSFLKGDTNLELYVFANIAFLPLNEFDIERMEPSLKFFWTVLGYLCLFWTNLFESTTLCEHNVTINITTSACIIHNAADHLTLALLGALFTLKLKLCKQVMRHLQHDQYFRCPQKSIHCNLIAEPLQIPNLVDQVRVRCLRPQLLARCHAIVLSRLRVVIGVY